MNKYALRIGSYFLGGIILCNISSTFAEDQDASPSRLICSFDNGVSTSYESGKFSSQQAKELSFILSNINLEGQTAQLEINPDNKPLIVRIVRAINANHFLEVVNEGFLNLTTIYDKDLNTGLYPAVHSRHFGILGRPLFAHYTGACEDH